MGHDGVFRMKIMASVFCKTVMFAYVVGVCLLIVPPGASLASGTVVPLVTITPENLSEHGLEKDLVVGLVTWESIGCVALFAFVKGDDVDFRIQMADDPRVRNQMWFGIPVQQEQCTVANEQWSSIGIPVGTNELQEAVLFIDFTDSGKRLRLKVSDFSTDNETWQARVKSLGEIEYEDPEGLIKRLRLWLSMVSGIAVVCFAGILVGFIRGRHRSG